MINLDPLIDSLDEFFDGTIQIEEVFSCIKEMKAFLDSKDCLLNNITKTEIIGILNELENLLRASPVQEESVAILVDKLIHIEDDLQQLKDTEHLQQHIESAPLNHQLNHQCEVDESCVQPIDSNFIEVEDISEEIERYEKSLQEEDFLTENYLILENSLLHYLDGSLKQEKLLDLIDNMLKNAVLAMDEYKSYYMDQDEWTAETAAGDKLLMEGLDEWSRVLISLKDHCQSDSADSIAQDMDLFFEANKKLVLVQYYAKEVHDRYYIHERQ